MKLIYLELCCAAFLAVLINTTDPAEQSPLVVLFAFALLVPVIALIVRLIYRFIGRPITVTSRYLRAVCAVVFLAYLSLQGITFIEAIIFSTLFLLIWFVKKRNTNSSY